MDIEKLATSAVVDSISMTDVLSPFINDGDKEPAWDGNIYIYEDKRKTKKGIKKVPVQVKGELRKRVPPKKLLKFPVSFTDLDNWLNDGGIILFVVLVDESGINKEIYYSSLLPVLIRHLKKFAHGKKSLSVPLKLFPADNNKKVGVLIDFYNNRQKQMSFANAPLYTIDELNKKGVLENITLTVTGYGKREDIRDIEPLLFQNDVYLYANVKGSPIPLPLPDILADIHIEKEVVAPVKVKNRIFYNKYRVDRYAEGFDLHIGNSLTMKYLNGKEKQIMNFKVSGGLNDYILDTECIIAIIENREITINGAEIKFDDLENVDVEQYKRNLLYYRDVKKMLDLMGVKEDLDCGNLSEQDEKNIRNFTNAMVYGKEIGFPGSKNNVICGRFKIANLVLLVWADKVSDNGYRLQSFFSDHQIALFEQSDRKRERPHRITHYVMLKKNDFIDVANIDYSKIINGLSQNETSSIVIEQITLFMLEMLKAYDEQDKKDEDLFKTAERYCEWLIDNEEDKTDEMKLNKLQIIKRKRKFESDEMQLLQELRKENHDIQVRCGANILLGKMESAQDCFDEMDVILKDTFIEYPICHFGMPHYKKMEDSKNG